jgi:hypothetical protein
VLQRHDAEPAAAAVLQQQQPADMRAGQHPLERRAVAGDMAAASSNTWDSVVQLWLLQAATGMLRVVVNIMWWQQQHGQQCPQRCRHHHLMMRLFRRTFDLNAQSTHT